MRNKKNINNNSNYNLCNTLLVSKREKNNIFFKMEKFYFQEIIMIKV